MGGRSWGIALTRCHHNLLARAHALGTNVIRRRHDRGVASMLKNWEVDIVGSQVTQQFGGRRYFYVNAHLQRL